MTIRTTSTIMKTVGLFSVGIGSMIDNHALILLGCFALLLAWYSLDFYWLRKTAQDLTRKLAL